MSLATPKLHKRKAASKSPPDMSEISFITIICELFRNHPLTPRTSDGSMGSLCRQSPYIACIPWFKRNSPAGSDLPALAKLGCAWSRLGDFSEFFLPYLHLLQGDPQGQLDQGAPRDPVDRLGQLGLVDLSRPKEERRSLFKGSSMVGTFCHQLIPHREAHRQEVGSSWAGTITTVLMDFPRMHQGWLWVRPCITPSPASLHLILAHPRKGYPFTDGETEARS